MVEGGGQFGMRRAEQFAPLRQGFAEQFFRLDGFALSGQD
jgi:hypothetical protein